MSNTNDVTDRKKEAGGWEGGRPKSRIREQNVPAGKKTPPCFLIRSVCVCVCMCVCVRVCVCVCVT